MTIDINKIRVGDELGLKPARVVALGNGCVRGRWGDGFAAYETAIGAPMIATHTPVPREFKPGDMVTWGAGIVAMRGEIRALDGEMAFTKAGEYYHVVRVCLLRHADPAPAPQEAGKAEPPKDALQAERFWMVAGNGPSSTRHRTKEKAESEARRLSAKQPGTKFFVLEAVGATSTSAVEQPVEIVEPESRNEHGRDIQF